MQNVSYISPAVLDAAEKELERDPVAKQIDSLNKQLVAKQYEVLEITRDLNFAKAQRPEIKIKWRDSATWCLTIDSGNPMYFLKSTTGVCDCIGFKHKIDIGSYIKNRIGTTLSMMFKEKSIGRITIGSTHYYGLSKFFNDGVELTELKDEYKPNLDKLIL